MDSILSFLKNLFFKSDDGHAISRQEKRRLPKSTARFPAKKRCHSPLPVGFPWDFPPPPPESVRTDGRTYADVATKIFRIDTLPNFLSNGAPLAGFARRLRYNLRQLEHFLLTKKCPVYIIAVCLLH